MVSSVAKLGERPEALRQTKVNNGHRPPPTAQVRVFSPAKLFADHAFAARAWCLIACGAVALSIVEPYFIIKAANSRERVVVLDGAGTFSISPVLGFEQAKELHEAMTLWATLALFQRNPQGFEDAELAEFESDEDVDDEEVYAAMSNLYVAADKLMQRVNDPSVRTAFYDATDDVDGLPAPFGFDPRVWSQVQELANTIADAMDAEADETGIADNARTLRQLLVNYV